MTDIRSTTLSLIGALLLSATCVLAAVGPARAAEVPVVTSAHTR